MKKKGFTLAEVLITLAIIGVVAALTIPSVISNAQQQEFKTGLKKAVSVLNEAIQMNISQDGETPYENEDLYFYLQQHMSIIKSDINKEGYSHGFLGEYLGNRAFYTTDGMRFELGDWNGNIDSSPFILHESGVKAGYRASRIKHAEFGDYQGADKSLGNCGSYGLSENKNNTINSPCVVLVDVNGDKKPNPAIKSVTNAMTGGSENTTDYKYPKPSDKKLTDIFNILITDEKAIPFGVVAQRAMYSK